jgi:NAD(P)-dependent dehydrogenase (short-subunit alcohol dehydrogenase family)
VLADCNEKAVRSATEELTAQGHKALAVRCDVADDAQVEAMVEQTVATFGRLDAAYNNAGVQNMIAEAADASRDDFDRVMSINLTGRQCQARDIPSVQARGAWATVDLTRVFAGGPLKKRRLPLPVGKVGLI